MNADQFFPQSMRHTKDDYELDKEDDLHFIRSEACSTKFFRDAKVFADINKQYKNFLLNYFQAQCANCNSVSPCWLCHNMILFGLYHGRQIDKRTKTVSKKEERMKKEGLFAELTSRLVEKELFDKEIINRKKTINNLIFLNLFRLIRNELLTKKAGEIEAKKNEEIAQYLKELFLHLTEKGLRMIEEIIRDLVKEVMKGVDEKIEKERTIAGQLRQAFDSFHTAYGFRYDKYLLTDLLCLRKVLHRRALDRAT